MFDASPIAANPKAQELESDEAEISPQHDASHMSVETSILESI